MACLHCHSSNMAYYCGSSPLHSPRINATTRIMSRCVLVLVNQPTSKHKQAGSGPATPKGWTLKQNCQIQGFRTGALAGHVRSSHKLFAGSQSGKSLNVNAGGQCCHVCSDYTQKKVSVGPKANDRHVTCDTNL
jgi:hypothetical protein